MRSLPAALALCLLAFPAQAQRWFPEAGTQGYRYEVVRHGPGPNEGHRIDYDLVSDGKAGLVAVVRRVQHGGGDAWQDDAIDAACRAAMHAGSGEVARVPLLPAGTGLEASFLAPCAPQELFLALADILNVALIQTPHFGIETLSAPGAAHRFPAFSSHFVRGGLAADSSSAGGTIRLVDVTGTRATVEWAPDPMTLDMRLARENMSEMQLNGTERFLFRLVIDRSTGVLLGMTAPQDRLDLIVNIKDVPPQPVVITREVSIIPRPS